MLDTNLIIAFLAGEAAVVDRVSHAEDVRIPVVAVGELTYGALRAMHVQANLRRIQGLLEVAPLARIDGDTASRYGHLKADLKSRGRPIPDNDLWIAALALQHSCTLATRDRHFASVAGLSTEAWQWAC